MKFFTNKLHFCALRQQSLANEWRKRGGVWCYNISELFDQAKQLNVVDRIFWKPHPAEIEISRQRIKESLARMEAKKKAKEMKKQ